MGTGIHHILLLFTKLEVKLYQKNFKKLLGSIAWSIYHQPNLQKIDFWAVFEGIYLSWTLVLTGYVWFF